MTYSLSFPPPIHLVQSREKSKLFTGSSPRLRLGDTEGETEQPVSDAGACGPSALLSSSVKENRGRQHLPCLPLRVTRKINEIILYQCQA